MTSFALTNCDIYTAEEVLTDHAIVVVNGRIESVPVCSQLSGAIETIDLGGSSVSAGFIDVQVNGGGDVLFNDAPTEEGVRAIREAHLQFGVTAILPTFITGPRAGMRAAGDAVRKYIDSGGTGVLGIHFEGPALNSTKAGVHDKEFIVSEGYDDLAEIYTRAARGCTMVTLAPETVPPGFIRRLVQAGVRVSIGHSAAASAEVRTAIDEGARCGTHVWNAMTPLTSREPGAVGALLWDDRVWCDFVADGFHVDFTTLALSVRAKPRGRAFLVTDAMSPVGGRAGGYVLGPYAVTVRDGKCVTADGTLAGSALDLATAVRNCVQRMGIPKDEALRMASLYPAQLLGVDGELGRVRPGCRAELAVFDNEINVQAVVSDGKFLPVSTVTV